MNTLKQSKRILLLSLAMLLIPFIPFLFFGSTIEHRVNEWVSQLENNPFGTAILTVALLASDILLPIPSSLVCTAAGQTLGWLCGTIVCFIGLTIGGLFGFSLSFWLGRPLVVRLCDPSTMNDVEQWSQGYGFWTIVLSRPLPLVAEAVILLLGLQPNFFFKWLPALLLSNLALAACWTGLGVWSRSGEWEWLAGMLSILIPIVLLISWRFVCGTPKRDPNLES